VFGLLEPKGTGMSTHVRIDRQGRVVIPQAERERLGLTAGTTLELVPTSEGLLLESRHAAEVIDAPDGAPLIRLVDEPPVANEDAQRAIDQVREGA
jgi:AbrB family looped-hinge helix DNA binding protein